MYHDKTNLLISIGLGKAVRPNKLGLRNRYDIRQYLSFIHQQAAVVHKSSFSKTTLLLLCKGSICASTYSDLKVYFPWLIVEKKLLLKLVTSSLLADTL